MYVRSQQLKKIIQYKKYKQRLFWFISSEPKFVSENDNIWLKRQNHSFACGKTHETYVDSEKSPSNFHRITQISARFNGPILSVCGLRASIEFSHFTRKTRRMKIVFIIRHYESVRYVISLPPEYFPEAFGSKPTLNIAFFQPTRKLFVHVKKIFENICNADFRTGCDSKSCSWNKVFNIHLTFVIDSVVDCALKISTLNEFFCSETQFFSMNNSTKLFDYDMVWIELQMGLISLLLCVFDVFILSYQLGFFHRCSFFII